MNQVLLALSALAEAHTGPPATVLDHAVEVTFAPDRSAVRSTRWVVRIDDPAALAAGVPAPPSLDGAEDQGARVVDGALLLPEGVAAGVTLTFEATTPLGRGPLDGLFTPTGAWSPLPTRHAALTVVAPLGEPLSVWADPGAARSFGAERGVRRIGLEWTEPADVEGTTGPEAVWSTWASWDEGSSGVERAVDQKVADKEFLGRELAQDLDGIGIGGVAERVFAAVALAPGPPGTWSGARSAAAVARDGKGSAAERGLVLIAALRVAGFTAGPAWFRSRDARGTLPITVPAPSLLPEPLVVVTREGEPPVYIDPASPHVAVPDRPASVLGGTIWLPGSLPRASSTAAVEGEVAVLGRIALAADGTATWTAEITATGAAAEVIRQRLAPLDEAGRAGVLGALARRARPDLDPARVTATARGVGRTDRDLSLTVAGLDPSATAATEFGLRGEIAPLLAVALSAWLPPRIRVSEALAVAAPASMRTLGSTRPPATDHPGAVVERAAVRSGPQVSLTTVVFRPATDAATARGAAELLGAEAERGMDLLLLAEGSGSAVGRLRKATTLSPEQRVVLEALVRGADPATSDAALTRRLRKATGTARGPARWWPVGGPEIGFPALVAALVPYVEPADDRLWALLGALAVADADRAAVAGGLERIGRPGPALALARAVAASEDPAVRLEANLMIDRLQGPRPDQALEPERAELWVDPVLLATRARDAAASAAGTGRRDPRPFVRSAELAVAAGRAAEAVEVVAGLDPATEPLVDVILARAAALDTLPAPEARARILAAVARAPTDPLVVGAAADALTALGAAIPPGEALAWSLAAARMARTADRWDRAIPVALAAGDLAAAADAARRASDLDPESVVRGRRWATLAAMALDREALASARPRGRLPVPDDAAGERAPTLDERLAMDEAGLLAVLVHADDEVLGSPHLLAIRAELRVAAGQLDEAARDGLLLATRHGSPEGAALAFAAVAGRQFSTPLVDALDRAAAVATTAALTRMEYRWITGSGDPLPDARRLADEPRARSLVHAITQPLLAAASAEGWPKEVATPTAPPPAACRPNRALSTIDGVVGCSNPDAATAVLRVGAHTKGLPPPLTALYTARPLPVDTVPADLVPGGGVVLRLDGGMLPLYAARAASGAEDVWGLGFTPATAKSALTAATRP